MGNNRIQFVIKKPITSTINDTVILQESLPIINVINKT